MEKTKGENWGQWIKGIILYRTKIHLCVAGVIRKIFTKTPSQKWMKDQTKWKLYARHVLYFHKIKLNQKQKRNQVQLWINLEKAFIVFEKIKKAFYLLALQLRSFSIEI